MTANYATYNSFSLKDKSKFGDLFEGFLLVSLFWFFSKLIHYESIAYKTFNVSILKHLTSVRKIVICLYNL